MKCGFVPLYGLGPDQSQDEIARAVPRVCLGAGASWVAALGSRFPPSPGSAAPRGSAAWAPPARLHAGHLGRQERK